MKRINQDTGIPFKQGQFREDGLVFWSYVNTQRKKDGSIREQWYSPEVFHRLRVKNCLRLTQARCIRDNVPLQVTLDYLLSIFPKDKMCPILNINMQWGNEDHASSPSIDKIVPALGYVSGNVAWISRKANALKNDATLDQLYAIVKYVEFHTKYDYREAA